MGRVTDIFTKDFPECLYAFRGGHIMVGAVYATALVYANGLLAYSLYSGKMVTWATHPVDGRDATPILYWIYIAGLGLPTLLTDCWVAWILGRSLNKKP